MLKRLVLFLLIGFTVSAGLTGCTKTPEKLFKDGKYAEAYPEFVKRAGKNELSMKNEVMNGSSSSRHRSGNKAINDYYYAALCQKNLGNNKEANFYYNKVVEVSNYKIRTPRDEAKELKDQYNRYISAVNNYRYYQKQFCEDAQAYRDRYYNSGSNTDPYSSRTTDPYSTGGSDTDPYSGGNSDPYSGSGSNSDPYSGSGSDTDPYSGSGSDTDPYSGSGSGTDPYSGSGSDTDPYSGSGNTDPYDPDYVPDMSYVNSSYRAMLNEKEKFESLLYRTSSEIVPNIATIKDEYEWMSGYLDSYLNVASPYRIEDNKFKGSLISDDYYRFTDKANGFTTLLKNADTKITYTVEDLKVENLAQVREAQNFVSDYSGSSAQAPQEPTARQAITVEDETDVPVTGNLKEADANMRNAYNNYKALVSNGASENEVKAAAEEYKKAKKIYEALKKQ
jgi:hypothetical protein